MFVYVFRFQKPLCHTKLITTEHPFCKYFDSTRESLLRTNLIQQPFSDMIFLFTVVLAELYELYLSK